ncbi:uncharacterized protein LOC129714247 isoform X2 [Leucoraja erinacea]|uniref:uncharacterized protein LOC129714247 isoform X2 n=1 Tax=Leucoraja erinaceus TaxID=7782 RepID=UPI0024555334|nr:uncharacterized protein LOC129714247 isoform X2 [Leucoraja erinacea]
MDMMLSGPQVYGASCLLSGTGDLVTRLPPARSCCWGRGALGPAEDGARQLGPSQEAVGPTGRERVQQGGEAAPGEGAPAGEDAEGESCHGAGLLAELEGGSCHGAGPTVEVEGWPCHGVCPLAELDDGSCHGAGPPLEAEGGSCHGGGPPVELEGVPYHGDSQENGPIDGAGLIVEKGRGPPDGADPSLEAVDGPYRGASGETGGPPHGAGHTVELQCRPCHGAGQLGGPRDCGDGDGKDGAFTEEMELQRRECARRRTQAGKESAAEMRGVLKTHRHVSRELSGPISVAPTRPVTMTMDAIDGQAYGSWEFSGSTSVAAKSPVTTAVGAMEDRAYVCCSTSAAPKGPVTTAMGAMEDRAYGSCSTSAAPKGPVTTAMGTMEDRAYVSCSTSTALKGPVTTAMGAMEDRAYGSREFSGPTSVAPTSPVTTTTAPGPDIGLREDQRPEETDDDFGTFEQAGNLVVWAAEAGPVWLEDEDGIGGCGNQEDKAQDGTWAPWPEELAETVQHGASHGFGDGVAESWESTSPRGSPGPTPTSSGAWQPFQRGSLGSGFGAFPLSERQAARCGLGQPWWPAGKPGDVESVLCSCFPAVPCSSGTCDACPTLECILDCTDVTGEEGAARGRASELWATLRDVDEAVGLKQRHGCRSHGLLLAALSVDPALTDPALGGMTALDPSPLSARDNKLESFPSPVSSGWDPRDLTLIKDSLPQHQVNGLSPSHRLQAFFYQWAQADRNGRNKSACDVNKNHMA